MFSAKKSFGWFMGASLLTRGFASFSEPKANLLSFPAVVVLEVPERATLAKTGSEFIEEVACIEAKQREAKIMAELASGNIPGFLRRLKPIRIPYVRKGKNSGLSKKSQRREAVFYVTPDYLSIGSDLDYVLMPLNFYSAQKIAKDWQMLLPTAKMVRDIHTQADCQLEPLPLPAGPQMGSSAYIAKHDQKITQQRGAEPAAGGVIAGHKKDIVVSKKLNERKDRIAIYGWHRKDGRAIQPVSTVHAAAYADYSHGLRLVYPYLWLEGGWKQVADILASKEWAYLLSGEGELNLEEFLPGCAVPARKSSRS